MYRFFNYRKMISLVLSFVFMLSMLNVLPLSVNAEESVNAADLTYNNTSDKNQDYTISREANNDTEKTGSYYAVETPQKVTISGKITSYLNNTDEATIKLIGSDNDCNYEVKGTVDYSFRDVPAGKYDIIVSKKDHVTREYTLDATESDVTLDIKICPPGDIDGNGLVDLLDCSLGLRHILEQTYLDEYQKKCGDVRDRYGVLNMLDITVILRHINRLELLFDEEFPESAPINVSSDPLEQLSSDCISVSADTTYFQRGKEITFTITAGPVTELSSLFFEIIIPKGLILDTNSIDIDEGHLRAVYGFRITNIITYDSCILFSGFSEDNSTADSECVFGSFKCIVDDEIPDELIVGINPANLQAGSFSNNVFSTLDYKPLSVKLISKCPHNSVVYADSWYTPATCTEDGWNDGSAAFCNDCGEELYNSIKRIPALGHDEVIDEEVPASCVNNGLTKGSHCSRCGEVLVAQEVIPKKGHTLVYVPETTATNISNGEKAHYTCSECGKMFWEAAGATEITDPTDLVIKLSVPYLIGDANGDGEVDSVDATVIQRAVTLLAVPYDEETLMNADIDGDGSLTIVDATFIQRYDSKIAVPYPVGEEK